MAEFITSLLPIFGDLAVIAILTVVIFGCIFIIYRIIQTALDY